MIYKIKHVANKNNASVPGYSHALEAYSLDDEFHGMWIFATDGYDKSFPYLIQEEKVNAGSAMEACAKFREWLYNGLDKSDLMRK